MGNAIIAVNTPSMVAFAPFGLLTMTRPRSIKEAIRLWREHKKDLDGLSTWLTEQRDDIADLTIVARIIQFILLDAIGSGAHTIEFQLWVQDEKPTVRFHTPHGTTICKVPPDSVEVVVELIIAAGGFFDIDSVPMEYGIKSQEAEPIQSARFRKELIIRHESLSIFAMDSEAQFKWGRYLFIYIKPLGAVKSEKEQIFELIKDLWQLVKDRFFRG